MGTEPYVDAVHMERMGASGKCTDIVVLLELEQANGALPNGGSMLVWLWSVERERDGLDDGVVESVRVVEGGVVDGGVEKPCVRWGAKVEG